MPLEALATFAEALGKATASRLTAGVGSGFLSLSAVETGKDLSPDNPFFSYCITAAWGFGVLAAICIIWFLVKPNPTQN